MELQNLVGNEQFADMKFIINESEEIPAHKFMISARSPVLRDIIDNSSHDKIELKDSSKEAFMEFLRFTYSERIEIKSMQVLYDLVSLANNYKIKGLMARCEEALMKKLDRKNASQIFEIVHRHQLDPELKVKSFKIIQR